LGQRDRFAAHVEDGGEPLVVRASGALDLAAVATLKETLDAAFEGDGRSDVIVDLTELTSIDSTGIALLLCEKQAPRAGGGSLRIRGASDPSVRPTLDLAGVDSLLLGD
jgi:anti-sigma B factor antagonist